MAQQLVNVGGAIGDGTGDVGPRGWLQKFNANDTELYTGYGGPIFNVKTYGAVGDGVADDRGALQAAVDAAGAAGGGVTFLPKATYRISAAVVLSLPNVMVAGTGNGTIITSTANDRILRGLNTSGLVIRDLQVLGDADVLKTNQRGIEFIGVTDSLIHNVYATNTGYDGILLLAGCLNNRVVNCRVHNAQDDGINIGGDNSSPTIGNTVIGNVITSSFNTGIHLSDGSSFTAVVGNVISSCRDGIDTFQSGGFVGTGNHVIAHNVIRACTQFGVHIKDSDNNLVMGNSIDGTQRLLRAENTQRTQFIDNVLTNPTIGSFLDDSACGDLVFRGNTFSGALSSIRINGPRAQVVGNQLRGVGLAIQLVSTASHSLVSGNSVSGGTGHNIEVAATRCVIVGNRLAAGDTSVRILAGGTECEVSGNVVTEANRGIEVAAPDCLVTGNTLNGQAVYGIYAAAIARCQIVGNHVKSAARAINLFGATDTYVANNVTVTSTNESLVEDGTSSGTMLLNNRFDTTVTLSGTNRTARGNKFTSGASSGTAVLVAGTVTVSTTEIRSGDKVLLTNVLVGGTVGILSLGTVTANTSFVINSSSGTDTSTVLWEIVH